MVEFHRNGMAEVDLLICRAAKMVHAAHFRKVAYGHALAPPAGSFNADVGLFGGKDSRIDQGRHTTSIMDGRILDL